jgi:hypothetical protein
MLGTYASFLILLGCSALVGQAVLALCGRRVWSWLAPAVGLSALLALAWATVRLPGEGLAAAIAIAAATAAAGAVLWGRVDGLAAALRGGAPLTIAAILAASLPFIVEMRFGILGTGLNPDMSQHLFAADRLAAGGSERLISDGYPLGPHSLVVALAELGPTTVQAFDGLMICVAVITCMVALAAVGELSPWRRVAAALVVGFAYLLASNYIQGAFKEAIEAMVVLAFAVGLSELARGPDREAGPGRGALRAVPLAVLAIGAVYAYSFPGLVWLGAALGAWAAVELVLAARRGSPGAARALVRSAARPALVAGAVLVVAIAPEIGRMASFAEFETFDPDGAGLGNLFNRLSPLEALGIWPSGDFRVEPGDGAVPAIAFYLGAALGAAALAYGMRWWVRRGELAIPAALGAAASLWLLALVGGTPYQEAKALVIIAPLVALISVRALLAGAPTAVALVFVAAAGGSGLLALVNGPVGPSGYRPALAEVAAELGEGSTVVTAPAELVDDQHGRDYLLWELRGNRICVIAEGSGEQPPPGPAGQLSVLIDKDGAVVPQGAYLSPDGAGGDPGPCPLIEDGARADPAGDG